MRRPVRELVVGTALAVALGVTATSILSRDALNSPQFVAPDPGGGNVAPLAGASQPIQPRQPNTAGEQRLLLVYRPFEIAQEGASAYSVVTLPQLGQQFPTIGFMPGNHSSTRPSEVSVSIPTPEIVMLATRDGSGCTWLHELGGGPELVHLRAARTCAAATPPRSGWAAVPRA